MVFVFFYIVLGICFIFGIFGIYVFDFFIKLFKSFLVLSGFESKRRCFIRFRFIVKVGLLIGFLGFSGFNEFDLFSIG